MSIDFSGGGLDAEELEPLVTTSLTREDEGEYSLRPKTLKEYIQKGFVLNDELMKNGRPFGRDYFDELLVLYPVSNNSLRL